MAKFRKAGVTVRALIQRINRKLTPDDEMQKTTRGERMEAELGRYFRFNGILHKDVDTEALAREMGVLMAGERVIE
jgi:hypothetical protein